jgi:hypothetical protein
MAGTFSKRIKRRRNNNMQTFKQEMENNYYRPERLDQSPFNRQVAGIWPYNAVPQANGAWPVKITNFSTHEKENLAII